jgi:hypothetical protein
LPESSAASAPDTLANIAIQNMIALICFICTHIRLKLSFRL